MASLKKGVPTCHSGCGHTIDARCTMRRCGACCPGPCQYHHGLDVDGKPQTKPKEDTSSSSANANQIGDGKD